MPSSSDAHYSSTKQKLISFCTTEGIKTVKGRLIQSNQKGKWIEDNGEDKWKAVFAVYRYNDDFIKWLKADDASNSDLNKQSKPSQKYSKLKDACTRLLKRNWREIKDSRYFNYGSWWCVELGYTTIEEKIKKDDNSWSLKDQNASDWTEVKNKWAETLMVKEQVKKAQSPTPSSDDLTEDGLKELCKSEEGKGVKSKLSDDDSYQDKYLVIKAVCSANSGGSA